MTRIPTLGRCTSPHLSLSLACVLLLLVGCGRGPAPTQPEKDASETFTWHNPVRTGPMWIRDPTILEVEGTYYMTGTYQNGGISEFDPSAWPGIKLWMSDDLITWRELPGYLVNNAQFGWFDTHMWAPEIFAYQDKFYLTFSGRDKGGNCGVQSLAVAVAEHVEGPYEVLTPDAPLLCGNDTNLFEDEGKLYVLQTGITITEISLAPLAVIGETKQVITPSTVKGAWDSQIIEGPFMVKRLGTYYLFWSGTARGYEIGYATATHPLGPYTKYPDNPIYGACRAEQRKTCGQAPENPFREVGHGNPFTGPDGRLWLSLHGIGDGQGYRSPRLVLDPLEFDTAAGVWSGSVSYTPQALPLPQFVSDSAVASSGKRHAR